MPRPERRLGIGIDIGGTKLRAARVAPDGRIEAQRQLPTQREAGAVLADCLALVAELRTPEVAGLGVGVPGQVDARTGQVFSGGYVDLSTLPFADRLRDATGMPVAIENDAAMALLGERGFGAARGHESAVLMTIGTGIGGAVLDRGRLLRGQRSAGQLGHVVVEAEGLACLCGKRGCVETTSSGTAFGRHAAAAGLGEGVRAGDLLAQAGNLIALAVLTAWVAPLRRAIDSLVAALGPEVVVLGGGLGGEAAEALALLPPTGPGWFGVPVRPALLGDDAGVVGAALAGLEPAPGAAKRVVLVNGVPASGKSSVARTLADSLGWPLLALDTVKQPFLDELPPGDRLFNRTLGRASYRAILDVMREAPEGAGFVVDAWFGFQPVAMLADGLRDAGVAEVAEIWCEAPPEVIGRRYAERVERRGPGHPGLDYVPELMALATRAAPTGEAPALRVDTTRPLNRDLVLGWLRRTLDGLSQDP